MSDHVEDELIWHQDNQNTRISATLIEGAEVVRTAAVSYATPILRKVFIQASTLAKNNHQSSAKLTVTKADNDSVMKNSSASQISLLPTTLHPASIPSLARPVHSIDSRITNSLAETSSSGKFSSSLIFSSSVSQPSSLPLSPVVLQNAANCIKNSSRSDDELTSLSWLQDLNILNGTALMSPIKSSITSIQATVEKRRPRSNKKYKMGKNESSTAVDRDRVKVSVSTAASEVKTESSTSDCSEELIDESEDQFHYSNGQAAYDPNVYMLHTKEKPPFSFSTLIFMAIEASQTKALPVKDIYTWIVDHYPYYKSAPTGWKNSVRHNLSLNKCFCKVDKSPTLGKGSLWMVDQTYRPNLVQAMSKAPLSLSTTQSLPKKCIDRSIADDGSSPNEDGEIVSLSTIDSALATKSSRKSSANDDRNESRCSPLYGPDPELFPRLARRLELHVDKTSKSRLSRFSAAESIEVQSEDVDAAAAMLVLKHGPTMFKDIDCFSASLKFDENVNGKKNKWSRNKISEFPVMVISSSPSLDHAYVSEYSPSSSTDNTQDRSRFLKADKQSPLSSVDDEAFYDSSFEKETTKQTYRFHDRSSNSEEAGMLTPPMEEANALLNLASIATSLASRLDCPDLIQVPLSESHDPSHLTSEAHDLTSETQKQTHIFPIKRKLTTYTRSPRRKTLKVSQAKNCPATIEDRRVMADNASTNAKNNLSKSLYNNNSCGVIDRNKFKKIHKKKTRKNC